MFLGRSLLNLERSHCPGIPRISMERGGGGGGGGGGEGETGGGGGRGGEGTTFMIFFPAGESRPYWYLMGLKDV